MSIKTFGSLNKAMAYVSSTVPDEVFQKDSVQYYLIQKDPDSNGFLYIVLVNEDDEDRFVGEAARFLASSCDGNDLDVLSKFGVGGWSTDDDRAPESEYDDPTMLC